MYYNCSSGVATIAPAVATELVQPLLLHLEQLEDNEDKHNKSRSSPVSPKAAVMPKKRKDEKPRIRNKCNNDELKYIECILETKDLWDKFHDYETEMIITKTGR